MRVSKRWKEAIRATAYDWATCTEEGNNLTPEECEFCRITPIDCERCVVTKVFGANCFGHKLGKKDVDSDAPHAEPTKTGRARRERAGQCAVAACLLAEVCGVKL